MHLEVVNGYNIVDTKTELKSQHHKEREQSCCPGVAHIFAAFIHWMTCHKEDVGTPPKFEHLPGAHRFTHAYEAFFVQRRRSLVQLGILAVREETR